MLNFPIRNIMSLKGINDKSRTNNDIVYSTHSFAPIPGY